MIEYIIRCNISEFSGKKFSLKIENEYQKKRKQFGAKNKSNFFPPFLSFPIHFLLPLLHSYPPSLLPQLLPPSFLFPFLTPSFSCSPSLTSPLLLFLSPSLIFPQALRPTPTPSHSLSLFLFSSSLPLPYFHFPFPFPSPSFLPIPLHLFSSPSLLLSIPPFLTHSPSLTLSLSSFPLSPSLFLFLFPLTLPFTHPSSTILPPSLPSSPLLIPSPLFLIPSSPSYLFPIISNTPVKNFLLDFSSRSRDTRQWVVVPVSPTHCPGCA